MGKSNERPTLPKNAVIISLTPFTDRLCQSAWRRLTDRLGQPPRFCQQIDSRQDAVKAIVPALTEILNIRHAGGQPLLERRALPPAPAVLVVLALAQFREVKSLKRLAAAVRREFHRSCHASDLGIFIYAGPVDDQIPGDALLQQFEDCNDFDYKLVWTDIAWNGLRLKESDALESGALFLCHILLTNHLQAWLVQNAHSGEDMSRQFSFGLRQLDLSEQRVQEAVRLRIRTKVFELLFGTDERSLSAFIQPNGSSHRSVISLQDLDNQSLPMLEASLAQTACRTRDELAKVRMREVAEQMHKTLMSLMPPKLFTPRPPPSFLRRFFSWLWWLLSGGWILWLLGHPGKTELLPQLHTSPTRPVLRCSADVAAELIAVEKTRARIRWIQSALEPVPLAPPTPASPFELSLTDLPDICDRIFRRCMPQGDELACQLVRSVSLTELSKDDRAMAAFLAEIDTACDRVLKLEQRHHLVKLEDYSYLLQDLADSVGPLFPGSGSGIHRIALVPPALRGVFTAGDNETVTGTDDLIVFVVLEAGVTLTSLISEGNHYDAVHRLPPTKTR